MSLCTMVHKQCITPCSAVTIAHRLVFPIILFRQACVERLRRRCDMWLDASHAVHTAYPADPRG